MTRVAPAILLTESVSVAGRAALGEYVTYRPSARPTLRQMLTELRPAIAICRKGLDASTAQAWRAAVSSGRLMLVSEPLDSDEETILVTHEIEAATTAPYADRDQFAIAALRMAERTWLRPPERSTPATRVRPPSRVALVGAGIVNLITALQLVRAGHEVVIFEAAPDPRDTRAPALYGCTSGGGNARMFTLTEADNYSDKRFGPSQTLPVLLGKPASAGGWMLNEGHPSAAEARWTNECSHLPAWLSENYTEDILAFNRESGELWDALRRDEPKIFDGVALRDGVLRLYDDSRYFQAQIERQRKVGALLRVLQPDELVERHAALAQARKGLLVGGMEVRGFTLAIHGFVANLLASLEDSGAGIRFENRIDCLHWSSGEVAGLVTNAGVVTADHYVISPGVYGADVLRGTSSDEQIHGVLGVWLMVPNVEPRLAYSLKVSRRGHATEDSNITVADDERGQPVLILGAGYGWVGRSLSKVNPRQLEVLFAATEDTASKLFPRASAAARADGMLTASRRVCVRPWTTTSLGVFEMLPAYGDGVAIVTGGHNTGGFAQAPAVARAVCSALAGRCHPMHTLYRPDRRRSFLR